MDSAQFCKVAVGCCGIRTVGCLEIGFEGAGQFAHISIGASEDVFGTHALVGRAMPVEVGDEGFCQRVVEHRLAAVVLLLQLCQLAALLLTAAAAYQLAGNREA